MPFVVAILLNEFRHAKGYFRVAGLPAGDAAAVVGVLLWQYFYDPGNGLFNAILAALRLPDVAVDAVARRPR